ncbi:MAG: hypothetical protein JSC085_000881 [Candidatus Tokpelaia sp. JSC085]|nr:MAG: hypothetical protein JSC085_000881 [Candidatus Tokpelaia sp. JSC085]
MDNKKTKNTVRILGKRLSLPRSLPMRRFVGGTFVLGGLLGFLPILGFWMLPIGLMILSRDSPWLRRFRRRAEVRVLRRWQANHYRRKLRRLSVRAT